MSARKMMTVAAALAGAGLWAGQGVVASGVADAAPETYPFQERIDRVVPLSPGARVSVTGTAGPVRVEVGYGDQAEVHIVRSARTAAELQCFSTRVDPSPDRLAIGHKSLRDRGNCDRIGAREEVRLVLPRSANLTLSGVAGSVEIGDLQGDVRVDGVAGQVTLTAARRAEVTGVAGHVDIIVASAEPSVEVSGLAGPLDLAFRGGVNADVEVSGLIGSVQSASPDLQVVESHSLFRARIGSGGARLPVSGVVGSIRLRKL